MSEMFKYRFGTIEYDLQKRTYIMGILNVTPDSFSDGNKYFKTDDAIGCALEMVEDGADFIDVGGESSRPGSDSVSVSEEIRRVIPVIEELSKRIQVPISIDTTKFEVADEALKAGAVIVNDITGMKNNPKMIEAVSDHCASAILMHIKGIPKTMQIEPHYDDVIQEIKQYLNDCVAEVRSGGVEQIIIDPGIGFGKNLNHNLTILGNLKAFSELQLPVLVGVSRKSFIGMITGADVTNRLGGTAAALTFSILNGANIVRVHDVKVMKQVAMIADCLKNNIA